MKLYRPVLIESAEQAEALPEGTLVSVTRGPVADAYDPAKFAITPRVGDVALVPIEAEEEFQDVDAYEASGHMRRHNLARYTTPWEET